MGFTQWLNFEPKPIIWWTNNAISRQQIKSVRITALNHYQSYNEINVPFIGATETVNKLMISFCESLSIDSLRWNLSFYQNTICFNLRVLNYVMELFNIFSMASAWFLSGFYSVSLIQVILIDLLHLLKGLLFRVIQVLKWKQMQ